MLHEAEINRSLSTVDDRCINQYVTCSTYSDLVKENNYAEGESLQSSIVPSVSMTVKTRICSAKFCTASIL